jgi:hypothetical protein
VCFGCGKKFGVFKKRRVSCAQCDHAYCGSCFANGVEAGASGGAIADDDDDDDDDETGADALVPLVNAPVAAGVSANAAGAAGVAMTDDVGTCRDCRRRQAEVGDSRYRYTPTAAQLEV